MIARPSETVTGVISSIIGAVLVIVGWGTEIEIPAEVTGALVTLLGWVAAGVTWYIARKQREGALGSAKDGTVSG